MISREVIAAVVTGTYGQLAAKWADAVLAALTAADIKLCPPGYVCVPEVISRMGAEIAEQLDPMIERVLHDTKNHQRVDMLRAILWDNKVGILRVCQAASGQAARDEQAEDKS